MKIGVFTDKFPEVSDTFVLSQIVGLIQRGHEVHIHATIRSDPGEKVHETIAIHGLLECTHYWEEVPQAILPRLWGGVRRLCTWIWLRPLAVLETLNVFRHGRYALNLSLLYDRFPTTIEAYDYDIIHCHYGINGNRALAMRYIGILRGPIITTFHGYDANGYVSAHGMGVYADLFQNGDIMTVGSDFMKQRLMDLGAPETKIRKMPMGVDLDRFRFINHTQDLAHDMILLFVGRLVEMKGVEYLVKAMSVVNKMNPGIVCQIAGDGSLRESLQVLADSLGVSNNVRFLGAVSQEEVRELFRNAHTFVLPSVVTDVGDVETQGVVLAEAQATGLPIIATRVGGIPESVIEWESAFLVPSRDPESLAKAILRLASIPEKWSDMGRAGRRHVEMHFDQEKLNDELVNLYESTKAVP
jgi:colanic acid/amylovoran biosynthesis glycosyltransferase